MKRIIIIFQLFLSILSFAQSPADAPLPEKFSGMEPRVLINHFPATVYASEDPDSKDFKYFWKHNTAVLASQSNVEVIECGAYIFYNNQWNLRVSYDTKTFTKLFNCPEGKMKHGQPYTFSDNWRTDNRLFGGWAMWYIIGTDEFGQQVYGVGKLETVGTLYNN